MIRARLAAKHQEKKKEGFKLTFAREVLIFEISAMAKWCVKIGVEVGNWVYMEE